MNEPNSIVSKATAWICAERCVGSFRDHSSFAYLDFAKSKKLLPGHAGHLRDDHEVIYTAPERHDVSVLAPVRHFLKAERAKRRHQVISQSPRKYQHAFFNI